MDRAKRIEVGTVEAIVVVKAISISGPDPAKTVHSVVPEAKIVSSGVIAEADVTAAHTITSKTTKVGAAQTTHMAAAKAAHVPTTATAHVATAAAGLRTNRKQAAGKQSRYQHHHHSYHHDISFFKWTECPAHVAVKHRRNQLPLDIPIH